MQPATMRVIRTNSRTVRYDVQWGYPVNPGLRYAARIYGYVFYSATVGAWGVAAESSATGQGPAACGGGADPRTGLWRENRPSHDCCAGPGHHRMLYHYGCIGAQSQQTGVSRWLVIRSTSLTGNPAARALSTNRAACTQSTSPRSRSAINSTLSILAWLRRCHRDSVVVVTAGLLICLFQQRDNLAAVRVQKDREL